MQAHLLVADGSHRLRPCVATWRGQHATYNVNVLRVQFEAPGEFTLWHGSAPDLPPRRRDAFYLELHAPATQAKFTTTLSPAGR